MKHFLLIILSFILFSCSPHFHPVETKATYYSLENLSDSPPGDSVIIEVIKPYSKELSKEMDRVIGTVAVDLNKESPDSKLGNWMADVMLETAEEISGKDYDFALVNMGSIRVPSLKKGSVTKGRIFELMPFDNILTVLELDAGTVEVFFKHIVGRGNGWGLSKGTSYSINGTKISDIIVNREQLSKKKTYTVVLADYIAKGGDKCNFLIATPRTSLNKLLRDSYLEYIEKANANHEEIGANIDVRVKVLK